ncbi:MAG: porin [Chromatiaceae bacterium]|jgi:long-chain fatty acid transport protein
MLAKIPGAVASALALCVAGAVSVPQGAMASGFALPELSTAGVGTANALVANPKEVGAFAYNPAAMGFHDQSTVAVGALFIGPSFSVSNAAGRSDSHQADWYGAPLFQAAVRLTDRWRLGLGFNAPFGLETRWAYGTFPDLSQSVTLGPVTIPTGNHPTTSELQVLDLVPSTAYRVNDNLSLGLGLDLYWAKSARLNSNLGGLRGDGNGIGFNLSVLYRLDRLSLGAAYHSGGTLDIDGGYTPQVLPLVAAGRLQPGQPASVDLNLPWSLQLGVRYEFGADLAVELDWTRTGWSEFDRLEVTGDSTGALIFSDVNDWEDANAYRLGLTYQIRPRTQLRFGYAYDETGQGADHFSARVPDSDRQLFGIGLAQTLDQGLSVELGYMYVYMDERRIRSATPYQPGGDVNGTDALNGDYEMDAHVIGIELVKAF